MWKRAGKRLSLTLERGHDGRFREVFQEDSCSSSMYKVYDCMDVSKENCHELFAVYRPRVEAIERLSRVVTDIKSIQNVPKDLLGQAGKGFGKR
jgi:hypothetical protein